MSKVIEDFFSQFQAFSFMSDDVLIKSGSRIEHMYFLKSGIIQQSSVSAQGQETTITFFKPGSFLPLIWLVKDTPISYDFKAVTNGHGWRAPKSEVARFLQNNSEVTFELCLRLLSGLEGMARKLEFALQSTAQLRICEVLLNLAYRFGDSERVETEIGESGKKKIEMQLTHQKLADLTGLSRETVTRELKILKEQGIVNLSRSICTILDVVELEQMLQKR